MHNWSDFISLKMMNLPNIKNLEAKIQNHPKYFITHDRAYLNWVSNDYLGLSTHKNLKETSINYIQTNGIASTGAARLSGYNLIQQELEVLIANFLGFEQALIATSGFQLNSGLYTALSDQNSFIFLDENIHASHIDGVLLSRAKFSRFNFNSLDRLEETIAASPNKRFMIVSEGTFSMDGTNYYLKDLIQIKTKYPTQTLLIIDDAHGIGALGKTGRGSLEELGLEFKAVDILLGTFSKAFGAHGGFIVAKNNVINYLRQSIRSQIYTSSLPGCILAAARAALNIITSQEGYDLRLKLQRNINYLKRNSYNLSILNPKTNLSPIILIKTLNQAQLNRKYQKLLNFKHKVARISYPTVPQISPRLRISLTSNHSLQNINSLLSALYAIN